MFVAASSRCFADLPFWEAVQQIGDLDYDKLEVFLSETGGHLVPSEVADDPEAFVSRLRDSTRITPIAFCLAGDVPEAVFRGLTRAAKMLRITQITIPASPFGTPFNTEIDRLREFVRIAGGSGIRLSLRTEIGHLSEDPHTAIELCQAVKGLGITLDPSHLLCGLHKGRPYDQIFPYVFHVHLRDSTPESLQVPIGLGEIDYNRLIAQLRRCGYELALSVDLYVDRLDLDTRPLEMRKLRLLLESLL